MPKKKSSSGAEIISIGGGSSGTNWTKLIGITMLVGAAGWIIYQTYIGNKDTRYIEPPIEANYGSDFKNAALPISIVHPNYTIQFVYGLHNPTSGSLALGTTIDITDPNGSVYTITQAAQTISANNGVTIKLTDPAVLTVTGTYSIKIRAWKNTDSVANKVEEVEVNPAFTLNPGGVTPGTLDLTLTPSTAYFILDGVTQLTSGQHQLDVGTHSWACSQYGYAAKTGNFVIASLQTITLNVELVKTIVASITVNNTPVSGGWVSYSVYGFIDYDIVDIYISQGSGSLTKVDSIGVGEWGLNQPGSGNGQFTTNLPPGTYTLTASSPDGVQTASVNFNITGGAVVLDQFNMIVSNFTGYTYFDCRYYDVTTQIWYDAGNTIVGEYAYFGNQLAGNPSIHNIGIFAISLYDGTNWTPWFYSSQLTVNNGEVFNFDIVSKKYTVVGGG